MTCLQAVADIQQQSTCMGQLGRQPIVLVSQQGLRTALLAFQADHEIHAVVKMGWTGAQALAVRPCRCRMNKVTNDGEGSVQRAGC